MCKDRETMPMSQIVLNVIYSIFLLVIIMFTTIGISTYQWIEATADDMVAKGGIAIPSNVPGLNKVSCGLLTYCVDAAGEVAECSLPWARYGEGKGAEGTSEGEAADHPIGLFNVAAAFMSMGMVLIILAWLYSLVICFGLFSTKAQTYSAHMVTAAGWLMVVGLLCFGGAFDQMAVKDCSDGEGTNADGKCVTYKPIFPSVRIEGSVEKIGCRICASNMEKYAMSDSCTFGWGGYFVLVAFILTLFASCIGYAIHGRRTKVENAMRRAEMKQAAMKRAARDQHR